MDDFDDIVAKKVVEEFVHSVGGMDLHPDHFTASFFGTANLDNMVLPTLNVPLNTVMLGAWQGIIRRHPNINKLKSELQRLIVEKGMAEWFTATIKSQPLTGYTNCLLKDDALRHVVWGHLLEEPESD